MKILNLPGKTGRWMPIEGCTICAPNEIHVKRDPRVMFREDRDWRDKYATPSKARKRKERKAAKWQAKQDAKRHK